MPMHPRLGLQDGHAGQDHGKLPQHLNALLLRGQTRIHWMRTRTIC